MDNLARIEHDKIKQEMIDGKIVLMSPRPSPLHTLISGKIFSEFNSYLKGKKCVAFPDGVAVYLDDDNYFVPDMMVVCDRKKIQPDGIHGNPDLVVEVLSPSSIKQDRGRKKDIYEKHGVKEYWIVDIINKTIEVYLHDGNRLALDNVYEFLSDKDLEENNKLSDEDPRKRKVIQLSIKVSIFENMILKLKDIFNEILWD